MLLLFKKKKKFYCGTFFYSSLGMIISKSKRKRPDFCADHPFLFLLVDLDAKTIIFSGRVQNLKNGSIHNL